MHKRHDGRNEPIVDPELPIIDSHHHLMDKKGVSYLLGDIVDDVSAGHNIIATVYIESHSMMRADGPELTRPVGETEFANGMAAMSASGGYGPCRVNSAIVAFADLSTGSRVAETLDAHITAGGNRFRGIRQVAIWHASPDPYRFIMTRPVKDLMTGVGFRAGFSQLAKRGLSFDAAVFHPQLGELAGLADEFPDTPIVLNHLGFAMAMGTVERDRNEVFKIWRSSLRELARRPNVMVKVGGLGMPFWGFGFEERKDTVGFEELAETWAPYVETGIEIFGADRCMMESNFPADGHSCGYVPLWNALKTIVKSYSPEEKSKLFSRTASRVYNIPIDFLVTV